MILASVSLLAPYGLLACLLAVVPLAVAALAFRRQRRVSHALGLEPAPGRRALRVAALPALACLLLGLAIAQPAVTTTTERSARTSSEVVFAVDVSRSMTASSGPGERTRLDRARGIVAELRTSVPDVPAGLSGLTDRILPYAFPTLDERTFSETLARSVHVESPPPQAVSDVATSFEPLSALTRDGFYTPGTEHRTCVLVTDGETRTDSSWNGGCRLLVVKVGAASNRIYAADGKVDAAYRPESTATETVNRLARAAGSVPYSEGDMGAAAAALRRFADAGPSRRVGTAQSVHALAPLFAALALAAVALDLVRRYLRRAGGVSVVRRHRSDATVGA
jgi:hypothetical protein